MQKRFIINLGILLLLNLLVKPFYILGIDAEIQNRVGAEVYGNYFALLNISFLFNMLLDLGVTNFNTRNIAQHSQLFSKHFSSLVTLKFSLTLLYVIVTFGFALITGLDSYQFKLLGALAINQFLVSMILYFRSNLSGLHLFVQDSIVSVLDRLILIAFCSILLWGNVTNVPFKIEWFIFGQTFAYGLTALIAFGIVVKKARIFKPRINIPFTWAILKRSFPYALLVILMSMYNRIDSIMLERMLEDGKIQAGIYAQGFRLLDAVNMFAFLFAVLLLPIFSKQLKNKENFVPLLKLSSKLLLSSAITVGIIGFIYQYEIMALRYTDYLQSASENFGILILSFIAVSTTYVFGTLLTSNGSLKELNYMAVIGIVVNIGLNLVLIPKYQAYGSAIATLITQSATALIQLLLAQYLFKLKVNYKLLAQILGFVGGVIAIGILCKSNFANVNLGLITALLSCLALSILIRLFSFRELISILKYDK